MTTDETSIDPDAPEVEPSTEPETPSSPETDDVTKWKAMSRKNEKAHKEALDRIRELEQQNESDQQKAVREAADAARSEVLKQVGAERVADAVRVAAAGRDTDIDSLVEALDATKFLDDGGNPDRARINEWVNKITPERTSGNPFPDVGQGHTSSSPAASSDPFLADLKRAVGA